MPDTNDELKFTIGQTLREIARTNGLIPENFKFCVNGRRVTLDYNVLEGDVISAESIDDSVITVRVQKIPGKANYFDLPHGATVEQALNVAGYRNLTSEFEVKRGTEYVALNAEVFHSDTIVLARPTTGN
ncbi:hypothetical protein A2533_01540 [Candidatus Falkowbacteria bacterium RIFOXYD2_FULL_35_9]|uniref:Ubiquitin-like domain-containing protein n=1 Tax=Candidatus Falkowbacteria bacterium RIFOXYC2_FULL_36_12 TaxID=1798002 RepID=A0A1F5SWW2_9BACT|nr:MAG: hypothetical protein A2478_00650 [Candidatus Falkowbacteria bacterium RIFOXYC2_FULL_36_12]OGF31409.1 MAG: hypothetical protein A2300_01135 [Candidatus Falkowbacteria bacterium RIFOXYB2_FULL_35_7]OGF33013.1 MAG: hypothetical protein A2223_02145 [Candidatus Falkowbacteria bacterium RIFOXYA2_FULL_35_8]OGF45897.1 MAG: hypothetical protein A2533_01540 [Candidatus Falkowbacteria bacterium RIFOXYD2_FULL_35_9]